MTSSSKLSTPSLYYLIPKVPADQTHLPTMMKYLAVALLISALLSPSNAGCQLQPLKLNRQGNYCWDDADRAWHAVGSFWTNLECEHCTCSGCCIAYSTPQSYPADCVSVFDWGACQYRVHKRNDPTEECPIYSETIL